MARRIAISRVRCVTSIAHKPDEADGREEDGDAAEQAEHESNLFGLGDILAESGLEQRHGWEESLCGCIARGAGAGERKQRWREVVRKRRLP
jgi:hypothetical protein